MSKLALAYALKKRAKKAMPKEHDEHNEAAMHEDADMLQRIMKQRYSEGGMVANSDEPIADALPAEYDDLHLRDHLEPSELGDNELGDHAEDEDRHDVISRAHASWKKKDRLPRPA